MPFADPTRCPDCRTPFVTGSPATCPRCALPLTGPAAWELFRTLRTADDLVGRLRAASPAGTPVRLGSPVVPVAAPGVAAPPTGGVPTTAGLPAYPRPATGSGRPAARRTGMLESGVPRLLLGLGAACLLVGSLVFLALAWVVLGVGGRTVVLAAMTAAALGAALVAARRPLPAATEAATTVASGLALLVVAGAASAGWLGDGDGGRVATLMGAVLLVLGGAGTTLARRLPVRRLVSADLAVALGGVLLGAGAGASLSSAAAGLTVATVALAVAGLLGHATARPVLELAGGCLAAAAWTLLALAGLLRVVADPTYAALWGEARGWPLVAATALAIVPAVVRPLPRGVRVGTAAAAGAAASLAALGGLHGIGAGVATTGWTLALLVAAAALPVTARAWRPALLGPALVAVVVPLWAVVATALAAVATLARVPLGSEPSVRLAPVPAPLDLPWVALVAALGTVGALALACRVLDVAQHAPAARGDRGGVLLLGAAGAAGVAVLAGYAVPLAVVVAALALLGAAGTGLALVRPAAAGAGWTVGLAGLALAGVAALPSDALLVVALVPGLAALALAALVRAPGAPVVGTLAELAGPAVLALWLVTLGDLLAAPPAPVRALAVLAVGVLLAAPRRTALGVGAALAVLPLTAAALTGPDAATWLAVHLTTAGAATAAAALLDPARRRLGRVAGVLLVAASWVRLADTGVATPEAYTLPAALVLLGLGVVALVRDPARATIPTLLSGLVLALAPSTLLALDDPASLRGLLLGAAALGLVLGGAALRWSAPLVAGAVVGGLLLLRALAPYAAALPPYVVILAAGAVLVGVGATWESRLASLRRSRTYVARLR